jgi:hypothetical protein
MVDEGVADDVKDKSGISDNIAIAESPLCFTDASNTKNSKNEYPGSAEDKRFLQANSCYRNITAIGNRLKNMHKQWSMID